MMTILVTYDVNTQTKAGRRRLVKVAQACKNFGQRVQFSVFECVVDQAQFERLRTELLDVINPKSDSLRIYKLHGTRADFLEPYGLDRHIDFTDGLVV